MSGTKRAWVYALNAIVPLILGAGIYVHFSKDTYFTEMLRETLPKGFYSPTQWELSFSFWRCYFCDMAWAYALTISVTPLVGFTGKKIICSTVLCICFSAILEALQLCPVFPGTFDPADLALETVACILAGAGINKMMGEKR